MNADLHLQDVGETHLCVEVYVVHDGKVLLHRRSKGKKHHPGALIAPGGHINSQENVAEAACREVEEETGIIVPPTAMKLKYIGLHHHVDTNTVWVNWGFLCRPATIEGALRQSEEGSSEWMDLADSAAIKEIIFPPSLEYYDHVLDDAPGILHACSDWQNNRLVRVVSKTLVNVPGA